MRLCASEVPGKYSTESVRQVFVLLKQRHGDAAEVLFGNQRFDQLDAIVRKHPHARSY